MLQLACLVWGLGTRLAPSRNPLPTPCTHTTIAVNGFKFICHVFQRWLLSERLKKVLELIRVHSDLVSDCTEQPRLSLHYRQPHNAHLIRTTTVSDTTSSEYSSHASSSGSCIPLMRSAEHFRKASDAALTPAEFEAVAICVVSRSRSEKVGGCAQSPL